MLAGWRGPERRLKLLVSSQGLAIEPIELLFERDDALQRFPREVVPALLRGVVDHES